MSILKVAFAALAAGAAGTVDMDASISASDTQSTPTDALCRITFGTSGGITYTCNSPGADTSWGSGVTGADYEIRATVNSGSVSSGTVDSWLSLGTAREWSRERTSNFVGTDAVSLTIEIRDAITQEVRDTATVTLEAIVDSGA